MYIKEPLGEMVCYISSFNVSKANEYLRVHHGNINNIRELRVVLLCL